MPKPFKFKLEKVLDYRGQLEEQAKSALAKAQEAFDRQQTLVDDLTDRMAAHMRKEGESMKSSNDMWLWRQYKQALEQDIQREQMRLSELELNLHRQRQIAIERSREKKLLEKLKEQQAKKYYAEESAREEKENDEMATLRHEPQDI